jgi:hypothetical protein
MSDFPCPTRFNWVARAAYDNKLSNKRHRVQNFFEKIKPDVPHS